MGEEPFAARSDRFPRNAFFATSAAGSSRSKCTPSTSASTLATSSLPCGSESVATSSSNPNAPSLFASGANSFAISANSPKRRGGSELELVIGRGFAEFCRALAVREPVQHGIDEAGFIAFEKIARQLDIFVDHDLCRHVAARHQFVTARPQQSPQNGVDPRQRPSRGERARYAAVDFNLMLQHAMHDVGKERLIMLNRFAGVGVRPEAMLNEFVDHFVRRIARHLQLIERLQCRQPRCAACLMRSGAFRAHRCANFDLSAISARQAREASPPLPPFSARARTKACSSSSTVRMPLPMASPSLTVKFIKPREDSLATISK